MDPQDGLLEPADWRGCGWIVFDAVGTLIEPDPSVAMIYQAIGARHGCVLDVADVKQRFRTAFTESETDGFPGGPAVGRTWQTNERIEAARWCWIVGEVLPGVIDQEGCFKELWDHFASPDSWRCFGDVGSALRILRQAGYQLAIASNFDQRLHRLCDELSDLQPLGERMVSTEIGFRKPAREFYDAIVDRCGGSPAQILMVGDDEQHDVIGPAAAGLKSLHLERCRSGKPGVRRAGPAAPLESLAELVESL